MRGKKLLALALALLMAVGVCPISDFAAEPVTQEQDETAENTHVEPVLSSDAVVFVSNEGNDENDGSSADAPVATLKRAFGLLGSEGGTIVVCGDVAILDECDSTYEYTADGSTQTPTDGRYAAPAHEGLVYITSSYGGTDYEGQLTFGVWNDHGSNKANHYILGGPTTFENIHFACSTNPVFYARGHFITMGEGITSAATLLVVGYDQGTYLTKDYEVSTDVDTHIILKSGKYHTVVGMTRQSVNGVFAGDAYITVGEGLKEYQLWPVFLRVQLTVTSAMRT